MIYFDNGATTFPKPRRVIREVKKCMERIGGNPSRSSHSLSIMAGEEVYKTRETVAELIKAKTPENVVFTYNATYALNMAIKTLIREKCHVITSDIEHNSVIRPLKSLEERLGIETDQFDSDAEPEEAILPLIKPDTRFIVSTIASNVTGKEIDINALAKIAKEHSLGLIIDASQALGHKNIDLTECECDAICAPAHKALFGIQGTGFVYFKSKYRSGEFIEGGSGTNSIEPKMPLVLPEGYEAGTLGTPGIVALRKGIEFINEKGLDNIEKHLNSLRINVSDAIKDIEGVRLYRSWGGNLIFNLFDLSSNEVSGLLDEYGICTRGGLHCSPSAHSKLGTLDNGTVRLTFSIMNTFYEAERFVKVLKLISQKRQNKHH